MDTTLKYKFGNKFNSWGKLCQVFFLFPANFMAKTVPNGIICLASKMAKVEKNFFFPAKFIASNVENIVLKH